VSIRRMSGGERERVLAALGELSEGRGVQPDDTMIAEEVEKARKALQAALDLDEMEG